MSVCIPTYEMKGMGHVFLKQSFDMLARQTFKDFDVVISDHSNNDMIKDLCSTYSTTLTIEYHRNEHNRGNSSANINNAIRQANGRLIKILFQDDFLFHEKALEDIVAHFDIEKDGWLVTACTHTRDGINFFRPFYPRYSNTIHLGTNTISSPSVLTIKNDNPLLFDENLIWLMDCEYYRRCHDTFGMPKILHTINVVNRVGQHQITNTIATKKIQSDEYLYILKKYEKGLYFWYYRAVGYIKELVKSI